MFHDYDLGSSGVVQLAQWATGSLTYDITKLFFYLEINSNMPITSSKGAPCMSSEAQVNVSIYVMKHFPRQFNNAAILPSVSCLNARLIP